MTEGLAIAAALGATAAAIGGVVAMLVLSKSAPDAKGALTSLTAGMLTRMVLLAAAVIWARRLGDAPLWWCIGAFFVVFAASQILEVGYLLRQKRALEGK